MANFCGNCGSRLDANTGLCPKCDKKKLSGTVHADPIPPAYITVLLLVMVIILVFVLKIIFPGYFDATNQAKCNHEWEPATCVQAKTCALCGAVEGDPLSHVSDTWTEDLDSISCKLARSVNCRNCGIQLESEEVTLDSFVKDNTFVFTPQQFMSPGGSKQHAFYG